MNIAKQLRFRPALPTVLNNADYQRRESDLKRMDEVLHLSGIEDQFVEASVMKWLKDREESEVSTSALLYQVDRSQRALRCMVLLSYLKLSYREMSTRLAECPLYQWFCAMDRMDEIKVPSKSELARFTQMVDPETLVELNQALLKQAAQPAKDADPQVLGLEKEIELKEVWMDSTAIKAPIHYPVDWVLLRDATRTLMKAAHLIRKHGLKKRMADPGHFIRRMNGLCMQMSATRRQGESKRGRKRVFRQMKKLMKTIRGHAVRHRDVLREHWEQTDLSQAQAQQVIDRIEGVLEQLPEAIEQAHARIIRGQTTENSRKILSLYEREVNVIVRGKPEAEIEFGNSLLLAEQADGIIVDWKLHEQGAPNDSRQLKDCVQRIQHAYGQDAVEGVFADRQFDSQANRNWLTGHKIYNGLCPRSPRELADKKNSAKFQKGQRRRAQTEARIAILKNVFLTQPLQRKGIENRQLQVGWSVLAHNLWLLSRLQEAQKLPGVLPQAA